MSLALVGFGTAVPEHWLGQDEAAELHATLCAIDRERSRTLRVLYRRSGIARRHSVVLDASAGRLAERQTFYPPIGDEADKGPTTAQRMERYEAEAPHLAAEAARAALEEAGLCASDVSHVVTVSCTGFAAPGVDTRVVDMLGLPAGTGRTHVGFMGCHGALNGLRVAESLVAADARAVVVVASVELCSLHFAYGWDPGMMVANVLFADGAAAVVGRAAARSDADAWRIASAATMLLPDSEADMSWRIGDHGFRMTLSARVPDLIAGRLGGWARDWLAENGLEVSDVGSWAVHPGGPRILSAVERALELSRDDTRASRCVLAEHGNMSSATVLFILQQLRRQGAARPCVALALGPGLVAEGVLIL